MKFIDLMKAFLILLFTVKTIFSISQTEKETSVLFIGNSFTFYNEMPVLFKDIAVSKGQHVAIDTVVKGGKNLNYHSQQAFTYEKIKERKWDYVVIQGHSNEFAKDDREIISNTLPYLQKIIDSVKVNYSCTKIFLYMTWGYKDGNSEWEKVNTYPLMQDLIQRQYLRTADFLTLSVSPVGAVWREIREKKPKMELYTPDNHHPTLEGSYVSACTFYTSIFGASPFGSSLSLDLKPKVKEDIELIAAEIVLNDRPKWRQVDFEEPMELGFDLIQKNDSILLVNNAKRFSSVEWFLGDGAHSNNELKVEHVYEMAGEYEITQRLSNSCGIKELNRTILIQK